MIKKLSKKLSYCTMSQEQKRVNREMSRNIKATFNEIKLLILSYCPP
jgi:hypothetical protein